VDCTKVNNGKDNEVKLYSFRTHLGEKLRPGDIAYGYDITAINSALFESEEVSVNLPEVVLVRKKYVRSFKRVWKLERMKIDKEGETEQEDNADENNNENNNKNATKTQMKKDKKKKRKRKRTQP